MIFARFWPPLYFILKVEKRKHDVISRIDHGINAEVLAEAAVGRTRSAVWELSIVSFCIRESGSCRRAHRSLFTHSTTKKPAAHRSRAPIPCFPVRLIVRRD